MILLALDLDNTLIHSYKKAEGSHICVEEGDIHGTWKKLSYMTPQAVEKLRSLSSGILPIPITTRSVEQFRRISIFGDEPPMAVTSNGGTLLINGVPDKAWRSESEQLINAAAEELERGKSLLESDKNRSFEVRFVDDSFIFTKSDNPDETVSLLTSQLDTKTVEILTNGSKVYILPKGLNKGNALRRLKKRLSPETTIAAGDSEFDIPMLLLADIALVPYNGLNAALGDIPAMVCENAETGKFAEFILDFAENYFQKYRKNP